MQIPRPISYVMDSYQEMRMQNVEMQVSKMGSLEDYLSDKEPLGSNDFIIVGSRHVETVVLMSHKDK